MRKSYHDRCKLMVELMRGVGFGIPVPPQGAFYVFADASKFTDDSYKFAFELLDKAGVGVAPGMDFGQAGKRSVRFSCASSEENIREAAKRLGGISGRAAKDRAISISSKGDRLHHSRHDSLRHLVRLARADAELDRGTRRSLARWRRRRAVHGSVGGPTISAADRAKENHRAARRRGEGMGAEGGLQSAGEAAFDPEPIPRGGPLEKRRPNRLKRCDHRTTLPPLRIPCRTQHLASSLEYAP